jgi:hypothetical protein
MPSLEPMSKPRIGEERTSFSGLFYWASQEEKAPFVRGRRGNPTDRHFSDEEIESMTAKQYRENVLGIKRGNGE